MINKRKSRSGPVRVGDVLPEVMDGLFGRYAANRSDSKAAEDASRVPEWSRGMSASLAVAAELAGVEEAAILDWAASGKVRVERLQGVKRYRLDDIMGQLAETLAPVSGADDSSFPPPSESVNCTLSAKKNPALPTRGLQAQVGPAEDSSPQTNLKINPNIQG